MVNVKRKTKAMTLGPARIMKAPGCEKLVKFATIMSGNTFGATFWTDGKREAPMLPDQPWLRKSPLENVMFWSDECEEVGKEPVLGNKGDDLKFAVEPSEEDYFLALNEGIAKTEQQEFYLRMRLWWSGNDFIRKKERESLTMPHLHNLRVFLALLKDEDDNQRLIKAEVLRELSQFEEALALLQSNFPEGYARAVAKIQQLAQQGEARVAQL
jgi:hypothetical protein